MQVISISGVNRPHALSPGKPIGPPVRLTAARNACQNSPQGPGLIATFKLGLSSSLTRDAHQHRLTFSSKLAPARIASDTTHGSILRAQGAPDFSKPFPTAGPRYWRWRWPVFLRIPATLQADPLLRSRAFRGSGKPRRVQTEQHMDARSNRSVVRNSGRFCSQVRGFPATGAGPAW